MHDAWCMMHDAWCMMHDAWCMNLGRCMYIWCGTFWGPTDQRTNKAILGVGWWGQKYPNLLSEDKTISPNDNFSPEPGGRVNPRTAWWRHSVLLCFRWHHSVSCFLSYRICSTSPWTRWGCTVGWGWSSSRESAFAACCPWETLNFLHFLFAWLWKWCQGKGQGSIRRRLCSELTEPLKI